MTKVQSSNFEKTLKILDHFHLKQKNQQSEYSKLQNTKIDEQNNEESGSKVIEFQRHYPTEQSVVPSPRFVIPEDKPENLVQYAAFYFQRLTSLKPEVFRKCRAKWHHYNPQYIQNILDIKHGVPTVIVGTLFKEMENKPSIMNDFMSVLGQRKAVNYCKENDQMVLEDSSGRIRLKKSDIFVTGKAVSGSILGMFGTADSNGMFNVQDYCFAGYPGIQKKIIEQASKAEQEPRMLFDKKLLMGNERKFVALISGVEFGMPQDSLSLEMIHRFLRGETGSYEEQRLSSQIVKVILCGNQIVLPDGADQVQKGSYGASAINQICYSKINDVLDSCESLVSKISKFIEVDIMPGEFELSTSFLPQQPMSQCLFPNLSSEMPINFVTNPHEFTIEGVNFIGTSGQNIKDMRMYGDLLKDPVEIMDMTLQMRHMCPTCPDTLRAYPFVTEDPFIISEMPHIYFAGNQLYYGDRLITQQAKSTKPKKEKVEKQEKQENEPEVIETDQNPEDTPMSIVEKQTQKVDKPEAQEPEKLISTRIISVPTFRRTRSIVLVDLQTLESYEYKFDVSRLVEIQKADELEFEEQQLM